LSTCEEENLTTKAGEIYNQDKEKKDNPLKDECNLILERGKVMVWYMLQ